MKFSIKNSVKSRLIISFICILFIPSLCIGSVSYQKTKTKVTEDMNVSAKDNIRLVDELLTTVIQNRIQDIDMLSEQIQASQIQVTPGSNVGISPEASQIMELYQQKHSNDLELTYVGTENGVYINAPGTTKNPPDYDPRQRPWYQQAMKNKGKAIINGPYVSKASGNMVVTVAKVTKDGQGVAAINISLKSLDNLVKKAKIGNEGYVFVLDQSSNYVVHPKQKSGDPAKGTQYDAMYKADQGNQSYFNGSAKTMVFMTNKLTGWKIAGTRLDDEITQQTSVILNTTIIVLSLSLIIGLFIIILIIRSIAGRLNELMKATQQISAGDLTETIVVKTKDEFGQLGNGFNQMIESLRQILQEVSGTAVQLASSSEELTASAQQTAKATEHIATSMQEMAAGTDQQVRSVEESAKTVGEMAVGVQQIAANSTQAADVAKQASVLSVDGSKAIDHAITEMNSINQTVTGLERVVKGLGERSKEIGEIVEVISGISAQTNLLALNAAIEAARAGEQGRGFAVVADEVRKLAEQSSLSAQKISDLIKQIQGETANAVIAMEQATQEVRSGLGVVQQAGVSFDHIKQSVEEVASQIGEVSAASEQMAAGTEQVIQSIKLISKVAEETASGTQQVSASSQEQLASMEEISASAQSLSRMAEDLQSIVEKFKV